MALYHGIWQVERKRTHWINIGIIINVIIQTFSGDISLTVAIPLAVLHSSPLRGPDLGLFSSQSPEPTPRDWRVPPSIYEISGPSYTIWYFFGIKI